MFKQLGVGIIACSMVAAVNAEDELTDQWQGAVELGYVAVDGNSENSSLKGHVDAKRLFGDWSNRLIIDTLKTEDEEGSTAERYFLSNQLNRDLSNSDYVFAYLSYDKDLFSGFDYQATVAVGYGRTIIEETNMFWAAEVAPGYRYSELDEPDDNGDDDVTEVILRLNTEFWWQFTESARFTQTLSVEAGEENTITKSSSALTTSISEALSLKLAYNVKYNSDVPDDKKHADTETVATIVYSF